MASTSDREFFASCGKGLEPILGDELRRLRVPGVRPLAGGVSFSGTLRDAYTALLWSRVASRVLLTLARVSASSADALYDGVRSIDWTEHIGAGKTIAVHARGSNSALRDTRFTGVRVKDAICDQLRERTGSRPDVDAANPDVLISVNVHRERATISIDLSGSSLEDRGYRIDGKPQGAPVRETLAAALLLCADWKPGDARQLTNPSCGNGCIAIEGAMIVADVAPGIMRPRWGFSGWSGHDQAVWDELIDEADARAEAGRQAARTVLACDADPEHLAAARSSAKSAGVADLIEFSAEAPAGGGDDELLLACAVLAGRELSPAQLPAAYAHVAKLFEVGAGKRALALLAQGADASAYLGLSPQIEREVKNGSSDNVLAVYRGEDCAADVFEVSVRGKAVEVLDAGAEQFAARLAKRAKQQRKWAARNDVHAYRVYDADLPDYNMAIDVYEGAGNDEGTTCVHVAEYAPPKEIDPTKAARRMSDALRIIPAVFDVSPGNVYVKRRLRAKGGSQYARDEEAIAESRFTTLEGRLKFEVNFADYLDTGLFIDHRLTRQLLRTVVKGKSFLNLFAYTGTASVYAAAGGAKFTTTVDLSNTYLSWAQRNMKLNGLLDERQEFVRADVLSWVDEMRHSKNRWDVIFIDPPTFSNSAKMGKRSWDVQRDHGELLIGVSRLLRRGGVIVFSCNLRAFEPDVALLRKAGVLIADITEKTIPEDFQRNPKVHHCYLLKRG